MPLNIDSFKTLFISEEVLKDNSLIDANVDAKMLVPTIKKAQDLFLQPLLSTKLFVHLQDAIVEDSLNNAEKYLLETYIQPCLIYKIQSDFYFLSTYRQKNKGLGTQATDSFTPAQLDEIKYMAQRADNDAEFYGERLAKYLRSNKDKFPSYTECEEACSPDIAAQKSAYRCPIFLG